MTGDLQELLAVLVTVVANVAGNASGFEDDRYGKVQSIQKGSLSRDQICNAD